ncbi:TDP-N-acetylfucosamine:lipid II N-acetylfucosaminyltransferase [anaerobic digester metagenome]
MILHVFDANNNFVNFGIECFENAEIPGHYLYFGDQSNIKNSEYLSKISFVKKDQASASVLHSLAGNCKLILFHGLLNENVWAIKQLCKLSSVPSMAWVIYGAELSNLRVNPAAYLLPETRKLYFKHKPYRLLFPLIRKWNQVFQSGLVGSINKISYAAHFMPQEVQVASDVCKKNFRHLWFSYIQLEEFVGNDLLNKRCVHNGNILIGNSASYSSNHIEAFQLLSKCRDRASREIFVPLSYGNKAYAKDVARIGHVELKDSFRPMLTLLPRDEYHEILLSCSCVIMNHNRQQALGNIIVALWLGARVFLNKNISTYRFLREKGVYVSSLDDLNNNNPDRFVSLNDEEIAHNRQILLNLFAAQHHITKLREACSEFL